MASFINDLAASSLVRAALSPQLVSGTGANGSAADLGPGDGPCFAVQVVGEITEDSVLTGRVEESHDGTTWVPVSGATFTPATQPGVQTIRFLRSRRYVRWAGTYDDGDAGTVLCAAIVVQSRKTF